MRPIICCITMAVLLCLPARPAGPQGTQAPAASEAARDGWQYSRKDTWRETLIAQMGQEPARVVARALSDFPADALRLAVVADWVAQDRLDSPAGLRPEAVAKAVAGLGATGTALNTRLDALRRENVAPTDARWAALYLDACEQRRALRLSPHRARLGRVLFAKHFDLGGSHYAYTEGQSDAQRERHFRPGSALCLLEMDGAYGSVRTLLEDPTGVLRDPDVSYDGRRVLFAWKKALNEDDYHLYEMTLADGKIRQITSGLGFADYEGAYLPNGDLIFNSTRCVQTVDCWWTEVSNLYTCAPDGRYLRRLSFDQVHTNSPTVTADGRVIYTRWDYNDRGQLFPQGLFQMNPDGTGQAELYGNNSWFPTTLLHARAIPGSQRLVATFTGHHTRQQGWLGLLDPARGRQENHGAQLIAPVRQTPAVRVDRYGQSGDQFQYPYPLSEREFLVALRPEGTPSFAIYFVTAEGARELLAFDPRISCSQPIPVVPRPVPHLRPSLVDYRKDTGVVLLQDIYRGPGLAGIPRGAIKSLRVIALEFRAAGIGDNGNSGPAGTALVSTPISIGGSWDVKRVLGTTPVYEDGSACFTVPARTPIYFQALDERGHAVQTMRSWTTLQPGESQSCVGCHESKNSAPPPTAVTRALRVGAKPLEPWQGPPRGFSFPREIQPILDRHCVRCHHTGQAPVSTAGGRAFDAATMRVLLDCDGASWRYTLDTPGKDWQRPEFDDSRWQTGPGGFGTAGTPGARVKTTWRTPRIWLRRTFDLPEGARPATPAFLLHHDEDVEIYLNGVLAAQATGYTTRYVALPMNGAGAAALSPGRNTLAVHCRQTVGGQYIDVGILDLGGSSPATGPAEARAPFSLKGTQTLDPKSLRKWSDGYRALANRRFVDWISPQSEPSMLPPYHAGAAKSRLVQMLEGDHHGVRLSPEEKDRIAVWIDLLVPYCGDYAEGLEGEHLARYQHFLAKRKRWEEEEARNIQAFLRDRGPR